MVDLAKAVEKAGTASEEAHRLVDVQREKLAVMSPTDPARSAEEAKLRPLAKAASVADDALTKSLDDEEAGTAV